MKTHKDLLNPKLTPIQFSELTKRLPEIRSQRKELAELAKSRPSRFLEILGNCYSWSSIYELSFIQQLGSLFVLLGMHEPILHSGSYTYPQQAFIEISRDGSTLDQWYEFNKDKIEKKHLLWLVIVLQRNILSIMLFHQSLGALVDQVRKGNRESFFKAVSIDRSILSCPTFADILSHAELTNDKDFFMHLRKALKGPSNKHMEAIGDLRYAIIMLRELGFDKFTDNQLISFFVDNGLYPKHPSAAKNLRQQIQNSKKYTTI
jgi:hypothetical protein